MFSFGVRNGLLTLMTGFALVFSGEEARKIHWLPDSAHRLTPHQVKCSTLALKCIMSPLSQSSHEALICKFCQLTFNVKRKQQKISGKSSLCVCPPPQDMSEFRVMAHPFQTRARCLLLKQNLKPQKNLFCCLTLFCI